MNQLHERVREARELACLTQESLALELGVTRGAVSQWEAANGTKPSVQHLIELARRSGMALEYLATGRGEKIHGAPTIAEERPLYMQLTRQQEQLLALFDALTPSKRAAVLEFLARFR